MNQQFSSGEPAPTVYSVNSAAGPVAVLRDLRQGWAMGAVWRAFAWDEIQNRYRRSVLGIAWIAISYVVFILAISIFFGGFSNLDQTRFIFYVATGYAAYNFLIGNVTDGCQVFRTSSTWIKSTPLPYSIYVYKGISRGILPFLIQFVVALVFMLMMDWRPSWKFLLVAPALGIYLVNAVSIQIFFGLIATRWRDIAHLVTAITRILFFLTPIIWVYGERGGAVRIISNLNPFTYYIDIFRAPILNEPFITNAWWVVIAWTIVGWIVAIAAASVMRRRLPFWL